MNLFLVSLFYFIEEKSQHLSHRYFPCSISSIHKGIIYICTVKNDKWLIYFLCFFLSDEYPKQSSCLTGHVTDCLSNTELSFGTSEIVKLLSLLLYHCGTFNFDPGAINPIVLGLVQCDATNLTKTLTCWDDFRFTFRANRSDPTLCR